MDEMIDELIYRKAYPRSCGETLKKHQTAVLHLGVLGPNRRKSALVSVDTRCCSEFVGG